MNVLEQNFSSYEISNDDSNKLDQNENEYIVQPGDTLDSIAMKLNLSPSRIQIINELYPPVIKIGDKLKIESPEEMTHCQHQIFVILSSNNIELPGIITFYPDSFVFEQRQLSPNSEKTVLNINIVSVISCNIVPHPKVPAELQNSPSEAAIMILCYLADPVDPISVEALSFVSSRVELNVLQYHILHKSKAKQKEIKFSKPQQSIKVAEQKSVELLEINKLPSNCRRSLPDFSNFFQLYGTSHIIDKIHLVELRKSLPFHVRRFSWRNIYTLSVDGSSFVRLFNSTKKAPECIMLIQTNKNEKIGCYLSRGLKYSPRPYGSGETFVFTFALSSSIQVFRWSTRNDAFVSANESQIMIGDPRGGDLHAGDGAAIWIDNKMLNGVSSKCPTFNSPPLVKSSKFKIDDIEIWELCV